MHPSPKAVPGEYERGIVDELLREFDVSRTKLEELMIKMREDFDLGLSDNHNLRKMSPIKMLPTYVHSIPEGTEEGDFFALDLGGTNFRVLLVKIYNHEVSMSSKVYSISSELMTGTAEELFGYIAECLASFVKEKLGATVRKISAVGFTFSFPVDQTSLTSGDLITWTKGFNVEGVVGQDVVALLQDAISNRKEIEVEKIALLNDTTGVMMSCAFDDNDVNIGLILGTGTNACYMEKLSLVEKWEHERDGLDSVIINTEWGAFGERNELIDILTQFDFTVDRNSLNPGKQTFEKLISGMYLGEIVRLLLVDLIGKFVLFRGVLSEQLSEINCFLTMYVSDICSGEAKKIVEILSKFGYEQATLFECGIIQDICNAVSLRAARLAAAGLTTIIRRLNKNFLTVAVDGSLFKKHPTFKRYMQIALDELLPTTNVKLRLSEDGSGRGAALVAAVARKYNETN